MRTLDRPYVRGFFNPPSCAVGSRCDHPIDTITLHFSKGLSAYGTAKWGKNRRSNGCAHFYVNRDGEVIQAVPLDRRAMHHGLSTITDKGSIGIEMANCGHLFLGEDANFYFIFGEDPRMYPYARYGPPKLATLKFNNGKEHTWFWESYPEPLVNAVTKLVADLVKEFSIPLHRIVGHEDVARPEGKRKLDPGPMWDWRAFMKDVCALLEVEVPDDVFRLHKTVGLPCQ